jgi:hypothetical protein
MQQYYQNWRAHWLNRKLHQSRVKVKASGRNKVQPSGIRLIKIIYVHLFEAK